MNFSFLVLLFFTVVGYTHSVAVISVDLGNDFYKVAIVKPGVPMEIVLNPESKRKTPTVVTLKSDERLYGDPALSAGIRKPQTMFTHFIDLLGKPFDHSCVKKYQERFFHHNLVPTERNTVQFKVNEDTYYTVEELVAMILNNSRNIASDFAGEPISNAIVTIPGYLNQAERRAIKEAAQISGLKLLQLMTDHAAVALNYGIFRRDEFSETPLYMMFFDMGSSSTKVSIVEYKTEKIQENSIAEMHPHLYVRGFGYDRTLGGSEFDFRLRDYLAKEFAKSKKTSTPIQGSPKAMAKLLKEATRVKQVLSANNEHFAQIEGLHEEKDFRAKVTRDLLDELCSDLYERVKAPIDMALKVADLPMESMNAFIVFGGSFRVPKVQDKLIEILNEKEISKNINADEAAALGAVYQAAHLSAAFRVKRFVVKDAYLFPIEVSFDRVTKDDNDGTESIRSVDRTVFNKMNVVPQKKIMTFSRMKDDFSFLVKYANLDFLSDAERENFRATHLAQVALSGVRDNVDKHMKDENTTDKGVKAHFRLDESGLLEIVSVESTFEKKILEEVEEEPLIEESAFSKLTSKIGSFFSSSDAENDTTAEPLDIEDSETGKSETAEPNAETPTNDSTPSNTTELPVVKPKEKKVEEKTVNLKEPVQFTVDIRDRTAMGPASMKQAKDKLVELTLRDMEKMETAKSLNDLESYIVGQQEKLDMSENYKLVAPEDEKQKLAKLLSAASDWLYDEGIGLTSVEYKAKLLSLSTEFKPVMDRLFEVNERPKAIKAVKELLNSSEHFLNVSRLLPEDLNVFTEVEIQTLEKAVNATRNFLTESDKLLANADQRAMPPVLVEDYRIKYTSLERDLQYLVNKARYAKPKVKPSTKAPTAEKEVEEDMEPETQKPAEDQSPTRPVPDEAGEIPDTTSPEPLELPPAVDDSNTPNPEL